METAMLNEVRDTSGKFAPKSEAPRKVRSVNLTDDAWQWLAAVAEKAGMSRNDYLEALAFGNVPLMETAKPQPLPFMEAVKAEKEVDGANIEKQPDTELYPFIETVLPEVESVKLELEKENLRQELEVLKQELAENTRYYTARLNEAGATIGIFKDKLEVAQAKNQRLQNNLGNLQAEREELAQLKKEAKEAAAEIHAEGRSIELEKNRWQQQLSDARAELADAKSTILKQGNKIRELERGYSLKPNPKESVLRLEIGELRSQFETERADQEKIEAELSELKKNFAPAATLSEKVTPDAAILLTQLRAKRKKSPVSLADIEAILEIIEES
jgi:DNA repair exonuclease SbcCD ATPase subunit